MHDTKTVKRYLTEFFSEGAKKSNEYKIGVELEHFVVERGTLKSVGYFTEMGVGQILRDLLPRFPVSYFEGEKVLGLASTDYSITLEPGSQLEISINPQENIRRIDEIYSSFRETIDDILEENDYVLTTYGYLPKSSIFDLLLLPKKRYAYMDRNFSKTGTMGVNMMRGTASCQVSIDYFNETDFVRKIRCAYLLSPILSYMTSNTPIFEGNRNTNLLLRTHIWRNTDKARTGIIPGLFSDNFGYERYADYVLNAPAIFQSINGEYRETSVSALEAMCEADDLAEATELYISLMFPDVRLKQYIEIRVADSMRIEKALGYAALIKGLFFNITELEDLFKKEHCNENSILSSQNNLMRNNPFVYGQHVNKFIDKLAKIANYYLCDYERIYLRDFLGMGE